MIDIHLPYHQLPPKHRRRRFFSPFLCVDSLWTWKKLRIFSPFCVRGSCSLNFQSFTFYFRLLFKTNLFSLQHRFSNEENTFYSFSNTLFTYLRCLFFGFFPNKKKTLQSKTDFRPQNLDDLHLLTFGFDRFANRGQFYCT